MRLREELSLKGCHVTAGLKFKVCRVRAPAALLPTAQAAGAPSRPPAAASARRASGSFCAWRSRRRERRPCPACAASCADGRGHLQGKQERAAASTRTLHATPAERPLKTRPVRAGTGHSSATTLGGARPRSNPGQLAWRGEVACHSGMMCARAPLAARGPASSPRPWNGRWGWPPPHGPPAPWRASTRGRPP
jgi:hypothetical protein